MATISAMRDAEIAEFEDKERIAFTVVTLIICVTGLIANCFVIFTVLVLKEYKKAVTHCSVLFHLWHEYGHLWHICGTHMDKYVLQLATADTLFLLTLPFKASQRLNNGWTYSVGLCKAQESVLYINYYASILFLTVMCIDRYIAVCHTLSTFWQSLRKPIASYAITGIVWVIAFAISIPIMIYSNVSGTQPNCLCRGEFPRNDEYASCIEQTGGMKEFEYLCDHLLDPNREVFCLWSDSNSNNGMTMSTMLANKTGTMNPGSENFSGSPDSENVSVDGMNVTTNTNLTLMNSTNPDGASGSDEDDMPSESGFGSGGTGEDNSLSPECNYFGYAFGWNLYIWWNFGAMFIVPLLVMSICYGLIISRIMASSMVSSSRADNDRRRITYMCITLVVVFIWNWAWFHIVHVSKIYGINAYHETCSWITELGTLLAYSNSALNPILYIFLGTGFARKWQSIKEAPSMRYVMTLKTRSTDFFSSNTRVRTKTGAEKSTSHAPSSLESAPKESTQFNSTGTKQANVVTNDSTSKE